MISNNELTRLWNRRVLLVIAILPGKNLATSLNEAHVRGICETSVGLNDSQAPGLESKSAVLAMKTPKFGTRNCQGTEIRGKVLYSTLAATLLRES